MIEIRSESDIQCLASTIFDVIVDFRGQDRWLTDSLVYRGTTVITSGAVAVGTTYRESGPTGDRSGTVTELNRPTTLACRQPLTMRPRVGTVDVTLRYTLTTSGSASTRVVRVVTLGIPWWLKPLQPVLVRMFTAESRRTLCALKAYTER
jgi:Polyketide cyclase / dehydrase and lipid transport